MVEISELVSAHEQLQLATEVINDAAARGGTVRVYGGIAIYARCPSLETHLKLQRTNVDLDLMAASDAWNMLPDLFIARGFAMQRNNPKQMILTKGHLNVDIRNAQFREGYSFDFAPRLALSPITLPLVDLLLLKLQRFDFAEKDIQDAIVLLLDHRVVSGGEDAETIDRDYLWKITNQNWGLWTTVFDSTVQLEKILDKYLEPEEAQLVWRRIEQIQEVMDGKGKSLRWWLRAIPNRRIAWYRELEN